MRCLLQAEAVQQEDGISCEVIDLRTLLPWDREAVGELPLSSSYSLIGLVWEECVRGPTEGSGSRERSSVSEEAVAVV